MTEQTAALWSRSVGYLEHTHMGYVVPELEKTHPSWWAFERSGRKFLSDYQFKDPIDDTPSNRRLIADCLMDHFIFLAVVEKPGFHLRPRIPHKPDAIAHIISLSKHRHIHFILHPFTVKNVGRIWSEPAPYKIVGKKRMIVLNTINTEPPFGLFKDHEGGIVNRVYSQLTVRDMPWCSEVARHPDAVFLKNTKEVFDFYEAINPSLQLEATFEPVFYDY